MTLTFRSVMGAHAPTRAARQASHVPAWVLAEARLVRALPAPRTGMLRQLAALAIAWGCFFAALVSLIVTWAWL